MPDRGVTNARHLFVSYASVDRERVLPIVDAIRQAEIDVWIDLDDIAGGTVYAGEIAAGIEGCNALAVMCSAASLASHNVRQEIALAWKYRRPYLPLLLETVTIPRELEYWLEGSQWIEVFDQPAESWMPKIRQALARLTGTTSNLDDTLRFIATVFDVPTPLMDIVGRDDDLQAIAELLPSSRLVTLIGPGGTGKTRLALEVAHSLRQQTEEDIVFVDLAPVHDPSLVIPTIASRLGIQSMGGQPILEVLTQALSRRNLLLVLDNVEQVVDAATDLATLLSSSPSLRVLATSRTPLRIAGEREYPVAPLGLPEIESVEDLETLGQSEAVRMLVQQAQAVRPAFRLTGENAATIAEICIRIDGLPLAIELAAARLRMLSPQTLLERLDQRLPLLRGGRRDLPARQQTLYNTIDWSHDLLEPDDRVLLRRLSVFVGGWTLEAAEQVAGDDIDALISLDALVSHSLVRVDESSDEPRYSMLETIREFSLEQLAGSGEEQELRERHAVWVLRMVSEVAPLTKGPRLIEAMNRLAAEHANIRAALDWYFDRHDAEAGWRIVGSLWLFWWMRNHLREALPYCQRLLSLPRDGIPANVLAHGLTGAGIIHEWLDMPEAATQLQEDALQLWEQLPLDANSVEHWSHACLSNIAMRHGDMERASEHENIVSAIARQRGDPFQLAMSRIFPGRVAMMSGNLSEAESIYREALAHARQSGDPWAISLTLGNLINALLSQDERADVGQELDEAIALNRAMDHQYQLVQGLELRGIAASRQGRHQDALADLQQASKLARQFGHAFTECACLIDTGRVHLRIHRIEEAREHMQVSLRLAQEHDMPELLVQALEGTGYVLHASGQPRKAIRLLSAADALRSAQGATLGGVDLEEHDQILASLQSSLPESEYAGEWAAGAAMSMDETSALALDQR